MRAEARVCGSRTGSCETQLAAVVSDQRSLAGATLGDHEDVFDKPGPQRLAESVPRAVDRGGKREFAIASGRAGIARLARDHGVEARVGEEVRDLRRDVDAVVDAKAV